MRNKVLIVDDSKFNRQVLIDLLEGEYPIIEAENGQQALDIIEKSSDDIIAVLLDIVMPVMDGVTLLKILKEKKIAEQFPILIVTSEQSVNLVAECFDYGISDFIRKPVNKDFVKQRVDKLVELYMQKNEFENRLERTTKALKMQYRLLQQQVTQQKKNNDKIIDILGTVVEYRNMEGKYHVKRVKELTRILSKHVMKNYPEYELTDEKIDIIASASVLHDVGKVMISDVILLKPGKLTQQEFEYVKSHSLRGYDIINSISNLWDKEYLNYILQVTRSHHEKYDGSGYPDGLVGEEIPIAAQIVSIVDCYEALISESVYKDAIPCDEAFHMIIEGECGVFSYKIIDCFRKSKTEFEKCIETYVDSDEEVN